MLYRVSFSVVVVRGVYPKGGWESNLPQFWKWGVGWRIADFWLHIFDRLLLVVALGIPVMPIVNRDYVKLVLLYVSNSLGLYKQHIAQYCGDSDNRII